MKGDKMYKRYSSSHLKLIAMGLMLLDHSYKMFRNPIFDAVIQHTAISETILVWLMELIGLFGAISFWIFAYFIAEGCRFTHNRRAYLLRILLMGLVSEVPFQYMICIIMGTPLQLHIGASNVFFTLFLGGLSIHGYDLYRQHGSHKWLKYLSPLLCMGIAYILQTDFSFIGVAAIFICYWAKKEARLRYLGAVILLQTMFLMIADHESGDILFAVLYCCYALLSLLLLNQYNGTKGDISKWLFYLFYPLHISILVMIYIFLFI